MARAALIAASLASTQLAQAHAQTPEQFYAGRQITIIVPTSHL